MASSRLIALVNLKTKLMEHNVFHHWKIRRNYFWIFTKFCKYLIKMEAQKIVNFLNSSENGFSKFATKEWYVIDCDSKGSYSHHDSIKFLTNSMEWNLCDYSDAYVLVTQNIAQKVLLLHALILFKEINHLLQLH